MSLPAKLKAIGHYIKIANEHSTRDPAIYYWCLVYSVQSGMEIDKKSPECVTYLTGLLNTLEQVKKSLAGQEAVSSEVVAQAHIEEYGLKLFAYADKEDRAGNFNKNVVKAFYTSGHIFDILTLFGEIDEQIEAHRKYAKWKAAYIHNCLKNGETPVPGPPGGQEDDQEGDDILLNVPGGSTQGPSNNIGFNVGDHSASEQTTAAQPPASTQKLPPKSGSGFVPAKEDAVSKGSAVRVENFQKAQKHCKWAISAMEYEDTAEAIKNLENALSLLKS